MSSEYFHQISDELALQVTKAGVMARILPDAVRLVKLEDTPIGWRSAEGVKSFVGLPYLWRVSAGVALRDLNPDVYGAVSHFFALIKHYDNVIDSDSEITKQRLYDDYDARKLLVLGILHLQRSDLETDNVEGFIRDFIQFREDEWALYERYQAKPAVKMTFNEVSTYKFDTCSLNNLMAAKLIELFHPKVSLDQKRGARRTFLAAMMAAQVYDDQKDVFEDYRSGVPNYLWSALAQFPSERDKFLHLISSGQSSIMGKELRLMVPNSFNLCDREFGYYAGQITHGKMREIVLRQYGKRYLFKKISLNV